MIERVEYKCRRDLNVPTWDGKVFCLLKTLLSDKHVFRTVPFCTKIKTLYFI